MSDTPSISKDISFLEKLLSVIGSSSLLSSDVDYFLVGARD